MTRRRLHNASMRLALTRGAWLFVVLWLAQASLAHAAPMQVTASLSRDHARVGQIVTLTVRMVHAGRVGQDPDFKVLSQDFEILRTSRSVSAGIDGGRVSMNVDWVAQLRPRRAGKLEIPEFHVDGKATTPLTLTVSEDASPSADGDDEPVFVRISTDNDNPYVGQQVIVTVRLYHSASVTGALRFPQSGAFDERDLGDNAHHAEPEGGHDYQVDVSHFAVIPQRAGALELPPVTFEGRLFPDALFGQNSNGQPVLAQSQGIAFHVRAIPAVVQDQTWLPAQEISLTLTGLPSDGRTEVGQPMTVTLTERATGLPYESLPDPTLPKLDTAGVYPDKVQGKTIGYGKWLHGVRSRRFVVVPRVAGPLTIPEISLHWWNVHTDELAQVTIPEHTLTVVAAGAAVVSHGSSPPMPAAAAVPGLRGWRLAALIVLGLAALVAGAWLAWRRRSDDSEHPSTRQARRRFLTTLRDGAAPATQARCLLAWARIERPEVRSLGDLAAALGVPRQSEAALALQRACYAAAADPPRREILDTAFAAGFRWRRPRVARTAPLPPLYPPA